MPLSAQMIGLRFTAAAAVPGVESRVTAHSGRVGLASELTSRGASTTDVMLAGESGADVSRLQRRLVTAQERVGHPGFLNGLQTAERARARFEAASGVDLLTLEDWTVDRFKQATMDSSLPAPAGFNARVTRILRRMRDRSKRKGEVKPLCEGGPRTKQGAPCPSLPRNARALC